MATITISCDTCRMRDTPTCGDCVVTYLCERDITAPIRLDPARERALRQLASAGLAPRLRHEEAG
jgi:hypothetical protein